MSSENLSEKSEGVGAEGNSNGVKKHAGGRPTLYSQQVVRRICKSIRIGNSNSYAALCGGIDQSTFTEWMATKPEFAAAVKNARASKVHKLLNHIITIALKEKDWTGIAWILERTEPALFGKRMELSTGAGEGELTIEQRIIKMRSILGIHPNSKKLTIDVSTPLSEKHPGEDMPPAESKPEPPKPTP